jgi:alpha-tubulin suppressor-like RCC1 family protein
VMLAVLIVGLSSVVATRNALRDQYYNRLAFQAAESGVAKAQACLKNSAGSVTWSDTSPLRPDTDCAGKTVVDCAISPKPTRCGVLMERNIMTSFTVGKPRVSANGKVDAILAKSAVSLLRTSDSSVWRTYAGEASRSVEQTNQEGWVVSGEVTAGHSHTCAVVSGNMWCWGADHYGQLGDGGTNTSKSVPVAVATNTGLSGKQVSHISGGGTPSDSAAGVTCAVAGGSAYCWGYNKYGQVGSGDTTDRSSPTAVAVTGTPMANRTVTQISVGGSMTCAVADNHPYCWGTNTNAWPASNSPVDADATNVLAGKTVTGISVDASTYSQFCVVASGQVYCRNGSSATSSLVLVQGALAGKTVTKVSFTINSGFCAITSEKLLYCGTTYSNAALVQGALASKSVTDVSIGVSGNATCAIANGEVYCWGTEGRLLGQGPDAPASTTPVKVDTSGVLSGRTLISVYAQYAHVCVLDNEGIGYCWGGGYNSYGQLGTKVTPIIAGTPYQVENPNPLSTRPGFFF